MGNPAKASSENTLSYLEELLNRYETVLHQHRLDNPDLYQLIEQHRQAANKVEPPLLALNSADTHNDPPLTSSNDVLLQGPLRGKALRQKIHASHRIIRERVLAMDADSIPRTQAYNRKSPHTTIEGERECREDVLAAQIRAWRSVLPDIIRKFARIPDYRSPSRIKHSMTVVMVFGLFAFIFRLNSRRDMNRSLTGPVIFSQLQTLFPEINTIPHADTLARVLEHVDPKRIEKIHLNLIQSLVRKNKFKKLLIQGCLPIACDGTQKLTRDGLRYDERWCERIVGNDDEKQQYVYVLEANIILKNGLTIPLMTEYLTREHNALLQVEGKQDSETTAFERLARRLKAYFPRLKILLVLDAMFATQAVMGQAHDYQWDYLIRLPKRKLKNFAKKLNATKDTREPLPNQPYYRKRKQSFYWVNDIPYGYDWELTIHLIACFETYDSVNPKTGEIETCCVDHAWISSIAATQDNVHELINLGARKIGLMEFSINCEKNHGYRYKHAFSYDWNAMQGFHYLMRLGHAINALSEFTKKLKKYVRDLGCNAVLSLIRETLFNPWLSSDWYEQQKNKAPQLRLQLE